MIRFSLTSCPEDPVSASLDAPLPRVAATCCICLEERPLRSTLLPCAHNDFCADCVARWRARADTCPLCRAGIREVATQLRWLELPPPLTHLCLEAEEV